ncbi:8876_t:CDS:1, partial [Cetraspora pellucida]
VDKVGLDNDDVNDTNIENANIKEANDKAEDVINNIKANIDGVDLDE